MSKNYFMDPVTKTVTGYLTSVKIDFTTGKNGWTGFNYKTSSGEPVSVQFLFDEQSEILIFNIEAVIPVADDEVQQYKRLLVAMETMDRPEHVYLCPHCNRFTCQSFFNLSGMTIEESDVVDIINHSVEAFIKNETLVKNLIQAASDDDGTITVTGL